MRILPCVLGLMIALTAPALADAWVPVKAGVYLAETTDLRAEPDGTVTAHLRVHVYAYKVHWRTVPLHVLAPVDSQLVTAVWKPEGKEAVEVRPTAVTRVTWPGTVDQIERTLYVLHSGATPFFESLDALFPRNLIVWKQYTFTVEIPSRYEWDRPVGTLEVTLKFPAHEGPQGIPSVAWPMPVGHGPEYKVETENLAVEMVTIFDPETWKWRWTLPVSGNYSLGPSESAPSTLLAEILGDSVGICADSREVRVYVTGGRVSEYIPILVVMIPETETSKELQSGESTERHTGSEGRERSELPTPVPVIPIPPLLPRRRSSPT